MKDKPVLEKKNLDKGLKRSVGKPACCVSKGGGSSNTASLPDQLARDKGFEKRAQLYAAKAYSRQADKGGKYIDLKKVFFIAISNCNLFPDKLDYISSHTIRDEKTNEHDLKDFQFIFIELPKFPKSREEQLENVVDRWLFFFKYAEETTDEDLRKIAEKSPIIKLAYDELDKFHWNEKDLVAYEERVMDLQKEAAILEQKLDDATQKGRQEGRQEGIQIGHEKGREEGEKQAKIAVAKNLLKAGVSTDIVVQTTGLTANEVKGLLSLDAQVNIFVLDENPVTAAQMLCDKHIVKMPLETAQLLSSVFSIALKAQNPLVSITDQNIEVPYKLTHKNHPCSLQARHSKGNFNWLIKHGKELCIEYSLRYKRTHKSEEVIDWCDNNKDLLIFQSVDRQAFIQALPDQHKCSSAVEAYRRYYLKEKIRFAKWEKGREAPDWIIYPQLIQLINREDILIGEEKAKIAMAKNLLKAGICYS